MKGEEIEVKANTSGKLFIVGQNEAGSVNNINAIMTYGINTCCALVMHNKHDTYLAHIDACTALDFIGTEYQNLSKNAPTNVILYRRNGELYKNIEKVLHQQVKDFKSKSLKEHQPHLLFFNGQGSAPSRDTVRSFLGNPNYSGAFLGYQLESIIKNGHDIHEFTLHKSHTILNCMFMKSGNSHPIIKIYDNSQSTGNTIKLSKDADNAVKKYLGNAGNFSSWLKGKYNNTNFGPDQVAFYVGGYCKMLKQAKEEKFQGLSK